jgi:hypothetical protein
MRRLLIVAVMLALLPSCKKATVQVAEGPKEPAVEKVQPPRTSEDPRKEATGQPPAIPSTPDKGTASQPAKAPVTPDQRTPDQPPDTSTPPDKGTPDQPPATPDKEPPSPPPDSPPTPEKGTPNPPPTPPNIPATEPAEPQPIAPPRIAGEPNPRPAVGLGGVAQAVPRTVARTVALNHLRNLQLFIYTVSLANGRMPTPEEITDAVQKAAPQTHKLLQDGAIVLTGARSRQSIWAYTAEPQGGEQYLVVTSSGIERMTKETLRERLQQQ